MAQIQKLFTSNSASFFGPLNKKSPFWHLGFSPTHLEATLVLNQRLGVLSSLFICRHAFVQKENSIIKHLFNSQLFHLALFFQELKKPLERRATRTTNHYFSTIFFLIEVRCAATTTTTARSFHDTQQPQLFHQTILQERSSFLESPFAFFRAFQIWRQVLHLFVGFLREKTWFAQRIIQTPLHTTLHFHSFP